MINTNIQVLRGVSVLLVILFHLEVAYFQFGYIGVDVFFLISGFLMPIILPKYSAWEFIQARAKRLLPALVLMVIFVLVMGYFLQMPGEYREGGITALSSLFFLSQFYFMQNTGYFDMNTAYQPLIHTWSLGGEFLAYLVVLILLLVSRPQIKYASLFIIVGSAAYILIAPLYYSISYFDPVPRLYLFFIAFFLSFYRQKIRTANRWLLLISILSTLLLCTIWGKDILLKQWPNPAIFLLPACILPLLLFQGDVLPFKTLTKFLSKIGDWSYSIYIWHWPVIVFERIYIRNSGINIVEFWLLLFVSVALGIASYRFVERQKFILKYGFALALIACCAVLLSNGALYRVPSSLTKYASIDSMMNQNYFSFSESLHGLEVFTISPHSFGEETTLIVGDSHSRHILPIYNEGYKGAIFRIAIQPEEVYENWKSFTEVLNDLDVDKVLFVYRYHSKTIMQIEALLSVINLREFSSIYDVIALRDIPSLNGDPVACLFARESELLFKDCGFEIRNGLSLQHVHNADNPIWEHLKSNVVDGIRLIDTHEKLCEDGTCITTINDEFIMRDDNHFNERLSNSTNQKLFERIFQKDFQ